MMTDLTERQAKFAMLYVELGNASEAYRQSYSTENSKPESVWCNASQLLSDTKVSQRVMELQEEARERHKVTVDSITAELDENRTLAQQLEQVAPMNQATLGKAKLHGLLVDKQETKHDLADPITEMLAHVAVNGKRLGT